MFAQLIRGLAMVSVAILMASSTGFRRASRTFAVACPDKCQDIGSQGASHKFAETGANYKCEPNFCHDDPSSGTCEAYHDVCSISSLEAKRDVALIEVVVARDDELGVKTLLETYGDAVQYNKRRHAVQVFGCDGSVIAHLPVSVATAASLE